MAFLENPSRIMLMRVYIRTLHRWRITYKQMGIQLGVDHRDISNWVKGKTKPDTGDVVYGRLKRFYDSVKAARSAKDPPKYNLRKKGVRR